jgi:putative transposase
MEAATTLAPIVGVQPACAALGVSRARFYRERRPQPPVRREPGRSTGPLRNDAVTTAEPAATRRSPPRALAASERQAVLDTLHAPRFCDVSPAETYATLLDEGAYLASERTMYRILAAAGETGERRNQRVHPAYAKPELLATAPNQVWSWDITKLLGSAKWTYYSLYVILDIFSRYVVGWMVAYREQAVLAERLIAETAAKQEISSKATMAPASPGQQPKS